MKVKELIERLQEFDQELEVKRGDCEQENQDINDAKPIYNPWSIKTNEEWYIVID